MLLQKTGWRIKQLISHRKNNDFESHGNTLEDIFVQSDPQVGAAKRLSWTSRSPTHGTSEFSLLRRTSTATTHHSAQISKSTHSSASSLCSCCDANLGANRPLSPGHLHPGSLCFPPPTSIENSEDGKTRRLIYSDQRSTRPAQSLSKLDTRSFSAMTTASMSSPTFDLLQALEIEPVDEGKTPTQIRRPSDETQADTYDNVEELIRETDEAFWAVGIALADAKTATQGWYDTDPKLIEGNMKKSKSISRKGRTPVSPIKVSMTRSLLGSKAKPKRRKSAKKKKKKTLLGRTIRNVPPPPTNTPRWTLLDVTTNVADVLSGKRFRIEADEMLTEERIQRLKSKSEIKLAAESRAESRASIDSRQSVDTEESTPTDPFHLESFSSRIAAAQNDAAIPAPAPEVPEKMTPVPSALAPQPAEAGMTFKNLKFPAPPRRPRGDPASRSLPLPTILESSPFPGRTTALLPSTHFTLTSPLFRHGPIRIERVVREPKESRGEEALDWTAFQMAISGTMDDGRMGNEWEGDEAGLEDIVDWWKSFGFQGYGRMERRAMGQGTKPIRQTNKGRSEIACPIRNRTLKPLPALREAMIGREPARMDTDATPSSGVAGTRQRRVSLAGSLPPSPMLDLVLPSPSKNEEIIPMGFNLGHDLGDFLNWEAHHVQTLFIDD